MHKNCKIILLLFLVFFSCERLDDDFLLKKETYLGDDIQTAGYYYSYCESDTTKAGTLIFYRNGTAIVEENICRYKKELEDKIRSGDFYNAINDIKSRWGIFSIENDSILIEHLVSYGSIKSYSYLYIGSIINDSTILIKKHIYSYGKSADILLNDTFHFKKFSPKPDSTNQFVK